jgi:hypothetical protein
MTLDSQHVPLILEPLKLLRANGFGRVAVMDKGRGQSVGREFNLRMKKRFGNDRINQENRILKGR